MIDEESMMESYGFKKGQKVIYLSNLGGQPHIQTVTISGMGTYLDQYDTLFVEEFEGYILPSDVITRERILEYFEEESG